jgi:hypothetical protein
MTKLVRGLAALGATLALAACAAVSAVPAGPYKVGSHGMTLDRNWSDISNLQTAKPRKVRLLSVDGPLLNRLYVSDALAPGDFLVKPTARERPTPTYRAGMTPQEHVEFVTDSVSALEYQRVETTNLRPTTFAGGQAVRFDLTGATKEGLDVRGTAQVAERDGRLYVILYLAPAEHYFAANLQHVEAAMASARPL